MRIPITRHISIRLSKPLGLEIDRTPQLELVLPRTVRDISVPPPRAGYRLRTYQARDMEALTRLLQRAGLVQTKSEVDAALSICLPNGCFVVEHEATTTLAASMMARHLASQTRPFGGRIDWLATDPNHRGRGLGAICARSATRRLLGAGYENIWVTTDDHRVGALKIFLAMGFQPVIDGAVGQARWQRALATVTYSPKLL